MHVVVTREELARVLPAAGRYRVRIAEVGGIPEDVPEEIELLLRVLQPSGGPRVFRDRFRIRGHAWESLRGMGRLLHLLSCAGVQVRPETPMDLRSLVGLELLVDIKREAGSAGFPYVAVVDYHRPARRFPMSCQSRNAVGRRVVEGARTGAGQGAIRAVSTSDSAKEEAGSSR